jgi:hypothetical protein
MLVSLAVVAVAVNRLIIGGDEVQLVSRLRTSRSARRAAYGRR